MAKAKQTQSPSKTPAAQASSAPAQTRRNTVSREQIAVRAYEIFVARGGQHGNDVGDWLQAEQELTLGKQ